MKSPVWSCLLTCQKQQKLWPILLLLMIAMHQNLFPVNSIILDQTTRGTSNEVFNNEEQFMSKSLSHSTFKKSKCTFDNTATICQVVCVDGDSLSGLPSIAFFCTDMELHIQNFDFKNGLMPATFFSSNSVGYINILNLTIENSNLKMITAGAFMPNTVNNAKAMRLLNVELTSLYAETFEGLSNLNYLKLINQGKLQTSGFLQPMSETLTELVLQQQDTSVEYDPSDWLSGNKLSKLWHVDLQGNHFGAILGAQTFENLVQVRELMLANCALTSIDSDAFAPIVDTLEVLDLSRNHLTAIDGDLLVICLAGGVHVELYGNAWHCDCENYDTIEYIHQMEMELIEDPLCSTPEQWQGQPLKTITLDCVEDTTTTTNPTVSTTTSTTENPTVSIATPTSSIITTNTPPSAGSTKPTESTSSEPNESSETSSNPELPETPITTETVTGNTAGTTPPSITTTTVIVEVTKPTENPTTTTTILDGEVTTTTTISSTESINNEPTISTTSANPTSTTTDKVGLLKCQNVRIIVKSSTAFDYILLEVTVLSPTSVSLRIVPTDMDLKCVYFTTIDNVKFVYLEKNLNNYTIKDLTTDSSYIFCLTTAYSELTSPFNCRSLHLMEHCRLSPDHWLKTSDIALFVSLSILGLLLCCLLGMLGLYGVLRWRPNLLFNKTRIADTDSATSGSLTSPSEKCRPEFSGYMECYKETHASDDKKALQVFVNRAPQEVAPDIPSFKSESNRNDEHGYLDVNLYEEISVGSRYRMERNDTLEVTD